MKKRIVLAVLAIIGLAAPIAAQTKQVDATQSIISWNAKKVTGEHYGKISLKSGSITTSSEKITAGEFIVDMTSIKCEDLPAGEWNDKLIGHLKSDDFFGVEKFKEAKLTITSVGKTDKDGNQEITGGLTIKDVTQMITFIATKTETGYKTTLTVDRTKYGIKYGSGKFFEGLGDKMIEDTFTLDIAIAVK